MSQRTFVEINHDRYVEVVRDPAAFVKALTGAVIRRDVDAEQVLRDAFGVHRLDQHHHSDAVTIFVNGCVVFEEGRSPHLRTTGDSLIEKLRVLIFTAAHGWMRSVKITREDRDRIVTALENTEKLKRVAADGRPVEIIPAARPQGGHR